MSKSFFARACGFLVSCACAASVHAQDAVGTVAAAPDSSSAGSPLTRVIAWAETKFDGRAVGGDGFYPEFSGLIPGSGFSAGPGYRHHFGTRGPMIDVSGAMSWKRYSMMQSTIAWPRLLDDRLTTGAQVMYQDLTQVNFFGVGRDSLQENRTDYRLKDLDTLAFATLQAKPWLAISGRAGMLRRVDIDSGTSSLSPSTETRFDEIAAPGLTRQPNYVHADVAIEADTRNVPGYPTSGGRYRLSMAAYHDQTFGHYSFRRVEADAVQYVPIGSAVLSARGRMSVSQTGDGQDIPFYLLPSLGGANSLRGYDDYRYRDRDLLLVGVELGHPVVRYVDAAVFYDAGTVSPSTSTLFRNLRSDYGVGVRLHTSSRTLARLDVARGAEGSRIVFRFSPPLRLAERSVVPYVP